ncbi:hypothetical protein SAMN05444162_2644 [Paenibacillaceae bacterium GAS479]|nr:hypothetical protein SAMN05444162_2644 [Paenibacillaceae bacterium GAS479]
MFLKKGFKKAVACLSIFTLTFASSAYASVNVKEKVDSYVILNKADQSDVEKLLDRLVAVRLEKNFLREQGQSAKLTILSSTKLNELNSDETELFAKLNEKGVRHLNQEEYDTLNKSSVAGQKSNGFQSLASSPPTWGPYSYVDMLTYGEKTITANNKTYTIWITYAIPKNGGGPPLSKNFDSVKLMNQPFEKSIFKNKIFDIYLQKAVGLVKHFSWIPFEYFWPATDEYTSFNTYDLLVSYASRMKYVWVYTPATDSWQLKASANNVTTVEHHSLRGFKNGVAQGMVSQWNNNMYSDSYDSIETLAVSGIYYVTSPVQTIYYKNINGGNALSFFPYYASYAPDLAG